MSQALREAKSKPKSRAGRQRCWCITSFDVEDPLETQFDPDWHRFLVYQLEECPETKRPHFQGYVQFHTASSMAIVKRDFGLGIHVTAARGSAESNFDYCTKEPRLAEPIVHGTMVKERQRTDFEYYPAAIKELRSFSEVYSSTDSGLLQFVARYGKFAQAVYNNRPRTRTDPMEGKAVYPWQQRVLDKIAAPRLPRQILWIHSAESGTGKSTFLTSLATRFTSSLVLRAFDKAADVYFQIQEHTSHILFDLPRAMDHQQQEVLIQVLEAVSDGYCTSTKYEPVAKRFNAHILVFSNMRPLWHRLPNRLCQIYAAVPVGVIADIPNVEEHDPDAPPFQQ